MLNMSRMLMVCCALAFCAVAARGEDPSTDSSRPCCGRESQRPSLAQNSSATPVSSDLEDCVCLKYIYAYWGDGTCSFYATDCFGSPFSWDDFCDTAHPQECDVDSCGTCFTFPQMPAPRAAGQGRRLSKPADHTVRPELHPTAGASFFEDPFFVHIEFAEANKSIKAKVFPILVPRKDLAGRVLPAQVFYEGIQITEFPENAKPRPVRGETVGPYSSRAIDHGRVLKVRTHAPLSD